MAHLATPSTADPKEPNGTHAARCDDPLGDAVVFLVAPLLCVAYYMYISVVKIVSRGR